MTLRLYGTTSGYVDIDAPSIASNNTIAMPNDSGTLATVANALSYASSASANANVYAQGYINAGRNLLYNGAMQVAQRNTTSASVSTTGYYTADRWNFAVSSMGAWTQTIENDAPTGSGFRKSLKMLCVNPDASPAADDYMLIEQRLEGQDVQHILKGTSSAQQLTLSFWVKSNVTGTYIAELYDHDNTRSVSMSYTISSSTTWERKTITFPADTTGAFDNDNNNSLTLFMWLGSGSSLNGGSPLQTTWGTVTNTRATGQTNLAAATNNFWQITGVQLEVGAVASPFEFKSFGQELRECERYFQLAEGLAGVASTTSVYITHVSLRTVMRASPTTTIFDTSIIISDDFASNFTSSGAFVSSTEIGIYGGRMSISGFTGLTQARFYGMMNQAAAVSFSGEL